MNNPKWQNKEFFIIIIIIIILKKLKTIELLLLLLLFCYYFIIIIIITTLSQFMLFWQPINIWLFCAIWELLVYYLQFETLYSLVYTTNECENYKELRAADRNENFYGSNIRPKCDQNLEAGWYRFTGGAGTQMAHKCLKTNRIIACGTLRSGWLVDSHPTVEEGIVTRGVCFRTPSSCCSHAITVRVRNCGEFMVYYLERLHSCPYRYCSTGQPEKLESKNTDTKDAGNCKYLCKLLMRSVFI